MTKWNIIFDLGNVLIDWDPKAIYLEYFSGDEAKIADFFQETGIFQVNNEIDGGRPFQAALDELADQFPHHREAIQLWWKEHARTIVGPIEGSVQILQKLYENGYPLCALTNWSAESFFPQVRYQPTYQFLNYFSDIVVSGVEGLIKPDRRIYELLLARNRLTPQHSIFVDDRLENLVPARELGMTTIQFTSPEQLTAELVALDVELS